MEIKPKVDISKISEKKLADVPRIKQKMDLDIKNSLRNALRTSDTNQTKVGNIQKQETDYLRPTGFRVGVRDQVWENAKDALGRVRDPVTGRYMSKDQPWDMGHSPGYEFRKHQESARERGITRKQFLDEYNNPEHYRPELPSSNRSHKGEDVTNQYFGD